MFARPFKKASTLRKVLVPSIAEKELFRWGAVGTRNVGENYSRNASTHLATGFASLPAHIMLLVKTLTATRTPTAAHPVRLHADSRSRDTSTESHAREAI